MERYDISLLLKSVIKNNLLYIHSVYRHVMIAKKEMIKKRRIRDIIIIQKKEKK